MDVYQELHEQEAPSLKCYAVFMSVCLFNATCLLLILGGGF